MGIQDRDWYDPKHYRRKPSDSAQQTSSTQKLNFLDAEKSSRPFPFWISILTWCLVFVVLYFSFASHLDNQALQSSQPAMVQKSIKLMSTCSPAKLPANGAIKIAEPGVMKRTDLPYSGLSFENHHSTAITATILLNKNKIATVIALPGQVAELAAPVGQYALQLAWGTKWCGLQRDFDDQRLVNVNGGITSQQGQTTTILVESDSADNSGLRLTNLTRPPVTPSADRKPTRISPGELAIPADRLGHFRIAGKVNNWPVTFLVDTGASTVAISRKIANEAGIYNCVFDSSSNTANGRVDVCTASGITIEFESFRVTDAHLSILPNMGNEVLLGMSILKHMKIQQSNGILRLTAQ